VIFDFEVFFEAQHIKKLIDEDHKIINRIKEETKIEDIFFDHEMQIPGLEGSIIRLKDNNYATKHDTLLKILDELYRTPGSTRPDVSVIILVPEGMVSLLIGSKGRQINSIMRESRTRIVVNPAIQKMTHRTVKIEGKYCYSGLTLLGKCSYIAHACEIIYKTLENISPNVEKIEKEPKPLELDKTTMTVETFVLLTNVPGKTCLSKEQCWLYYWQRWNLGERSLPKMWSFYKVPARLVHKMR